MQASYDGAEGVQLQSSEVDSDATDGNRSVPDETPVEAVAAAEAHAEAQNTIPPLPPAATPVRTDAANVLSIFSPYILTLLLIHIIFVMTLRNLVNAQSQPLKPTKVVAMLMMRW